MFIPILLVLAASNVGLATTAPATHSSAAAAQPLDRRVVGGTLVDDATEFPFTGALLKRGKGYFGCGGVILSSTKVLTAAHCVSQKGMIRRGDRLDFRAGSVTHGDGGQVVSVKSWKVHDKFKVVPGDYDVAVMTVSPALQMSSTIRSIPLVDSGEEPYTGKALELAGWGNTHASASGIQPPDDLQMADVHVVDRDECRDAYQREPLEVTERTFCTSGNGEESCKGDSGSPVVNTRRNELVGLVSWAKGCADPRYPGVKVNLADPEIHSWIQSQLRR